ncbi:hypothetical protein CRN15_09945 [Raoultella planticola]|uniref:Uncharacterized protein n=1 Tax=Raoultella planticola TaxID=575 RepID=A0A443VDX4_RAOPL|nr:hypothetical protein CRT62_24900 [Raoultella planticola]ATM15139.1 hypothetical protein CRN15_09945 [Raoultella planticola]MBE0016548.1 hypothetical protein [Raoultella planticola]PHH24918.1 hypothetical protein CRX55_13005 [Raoultella planticola]PIM81434.1 hypothetical protein CT151_26610 [Raoultella planticola]
MCYLAAPGGLQKSKRLTPRIQYGGQNEFAPPRTGINSEQNTKANDYPAFRRAFSTEVCVNSLNFAYGVHEITSRCANVVVYAQSGNIFVLR